MKSISRSVILLFVVLCMKCTGFAHAVCENNMETDVYLSEYHVEGNKIYIQPSQLHISNEGIHIFIQEELVFVSQLNCDEGGIYCLTEHVDRITDKCRNGHKMWCGRCGGCIVRYCKFRCICVEWE